MLKKYHWLLLACTYTIVVFVISLIKINTSAEIKISHFDKLVHVGIYLLYTLVWFMCFINYSVTQNYIKVVVKAAILALVTGVLIEVLQELNPNARSGDVKDVLANGVGVVIAVLLVLKFKNYHALNSVK